MSQGNGNGRQPANEDGQLTAFAGGRLNARNGQLARPETPGGEFVPYDPYDQPFDQSVMLRSSPFWPRAVVWTILSVVTFGIAWSYFAKLEQAIGATGQLKPQGDVKEVQAPVSGVVREVLVDDGDRVNEGDILMRFDSTTALARLQSLEKIREALSEENAFYRELMSDPNSGVQVVEAEIYRLDIPTNIAMLTRNRAVLMAENRLFRSQLGLGAQDANLGIDELERIRASEEEARTRETAAQLEIDQLQKQLRQIEVRLADARVQLATEEDILDELTPLAEEGAIARLQYVRQTQQVQTRASELEQLQEEQQRIEIDIEQGREQLDNTRATTEKTILDQIAQNKKQIAQIDSQLTKAILENEKRISEIDSEISQTQQQLTYQELIAPVGGTVFDMQVTRGFVANPSEMLLKIVPADSLVAEVFITNQDIGFVEVGQKVDVRIDSFPFSEFGDIKGEVVSIGDDALPPDEVYNFFRFPAKIRLDAQQLDVKGREIALQSGMSISANIKIREDRRVIDLFIERFTKEVENLKTVR